jgi:hypothetical protein
MDSAAIRFFRALHAAAAARLDAGHPVLEALERAAGDATPAEAAVAQDALRALEPELLVTLMQSAHKNLREDPAAILSALAGPHGSRHS